MYADDSQLYVDFSPCDEKTALANLQRCIHEVREWLRENFLLLNDNKTEVVIFGKDTTEKQLQIGKSVISSRSAATSLGCILDSKLNMSQHVSRVCKSANYYLHCIRKIRNFISMITITITITNSLFRQISCSISLEKKRTNLGKLL